MKYGILILDNNINTFSAVGSGVDFQYTFAYKDKQDIFKNINPGDKVIGYVGKSTDQFRYIFVVAQKNSDKECVLRKQMEVEVGAPLAETTKNVVNIITTNAGKNLFVEIKENECNSILFSMLKKTKETMESLIEENSRPISYETKLISSLPRNRIFFGAPGTGKSKSLDDDKDTLLGKNSTDYERVTFHPDYTYGSFVGTYKPIETIDSKGNAVITYKFVPGPFMRILVKALRNSRQNTKRPFLLLIEEINRANVAAVFGDVFQLLDRKHNYSEYPIQTSEDVKKYLFEELGCKVDELRIPDNLFIWATMNSADQGVYPMDTAFKRRWVFEYISVDSGEKDSSGKTNVPGVFVLNAGKVNEKKIEWNALRKAINELLSSDEVKVHEDKLLGPFFINTNTYIKPGTTDELVDDFYKIVESKVLMYLFEDAAKTRRPSVFVGNANTNRFSKLCQEFEEKGIEIFAKIGTKEFSTVYDAFCTRKTTP